MLWAGQAGAGKSDTGPYPIFLQKIVWESVGWEGGGVGGDVCSCNCKTSFSMGVSASTDQSHNSYMFGGEKRKAYTNVAHYVYG